MSAVSEVPANRVELEDGRWCQVRRVSVGDIAAAKYEAHGRGFEDADLDAIFLLRGTDDHPALITHNSENKPPAEFADTMTEIDFGKVWMKAKGIDTPKPSAPSSRGTRRSRERGSSRTNG